MGAGEHPCGIRRTLVDLHCHWLPLFCIIMTVIVFARHWHSWWTLPVHSFRKNNIFFILFVFTRMGISYSNLTPTPHHTTLHHTIQHPLHTTPQKPHPLYTTPHTTSHSTPTPLHKDHTTPTPHHTTPHYATKTTPTSHYTTPQKPHYTNSTPHHTHQAPSSFA